MTAALHEWHEFYLLIGTAGGTLVALLFVAASIGVGFFTHEGAPATRTYISPVIIHFTAVLFISALGLAPLHDPLLFAIPVGATGLIGFAVALVITVKVFADRSPHVVPFDCFAYGVIPAVSYVVIAAAGMIFVVSPDRALHILAVGLLLLLLINIRNAWDLVLTVVRLQGAREKRKRKQKR
jgi:hypothetical protein